MPSVSHDPGEVQPPGELYTGSPLRLAPGVSEAYHERVVAAKRRALRMDHPRVHDHRAAVVRFLDSVERDLGRGSVEVHDTFDAIREVLR